MNKIYKVLSIFLILIVATTVVIAGNEPNTPNGVPENLTIDKNPTSDTPVPEIEEMKLPTKDEEKARFANRMKYAPKIKESKPTQKSTTPRQTDQVVIPSTVPLISYSNPATGASVFGTFFEPGSIYTNVYLNWKVYSFYLPVTSYVYTDISGQVNAVSNETYYSVWMDGDFLNSAFEHGSCNPDSYCDIPIQRSRLTYLTKGWHNLYIDGYAEIFLNEYYYPYGYISIIAEPEYTAITVLSPNGGETWYRGNTKSITWKKDGQPGANVKIELYKAGVLSTVISSITPNDGIYSWYIPTYLPIGTDYKIKITSTSESKYNDWSNNNFKIY